METPFGTTQYEYDLMDRVVRVVAHDGAATLYEYDENGNRTAVRYANGMTVSYEYDKVNRLVLEKILDKNGSLVAKYKYTLGAAGERLKVEENDRTVEYEYDELFRLTKETVTDENGTSVTSYTYDKNSNRLTKTVDGEVTTYAYNELNQLISETGISYEYDLNGSLIKKTEAEQTTVYSYDAGNKLVRITVQNGSDVAVEEYLYDYAGNRIAKVQELKTIYYLVDTNGALSQVLAEYDDSSLITLYTRGEELISQEHDGQKSYYQYDGFDSVRMLADEDNNITDTYTFDAFGNLVSSTGETESNYLYRGEQYDSFTGLYYLRARYMNPSTGTFITMDEYAGSVFEPVSLHKYLYANANPVMYTDPTGYFSLGELNVSIGIQNVLNSMACGACMGAMIGGMYSMLITALRGGTSAEIQQEFLNGMANGFISGAMFGGLGAFASVYWQAELMRSMCMFMGGYYAVQAAMLDFANGDYLAGILNLGIGLSCAYSSANSASRAGGMRQNAWFNQSGNYLNDSGINQQSEAPDLPEVIRNIYNAERIGSALKNDVYHRAGSYLTENQLAQGKANYFVGGDGVTRILFQVEGGVNGHSGIFEYILEPNGTVSHQIFYPNGHFTDLPNSQ